MLFINLGARHTTAALACFNQTKQDNSEEYRYYGYHEEDVYDERSTDVLKTCHSTEVSIKNYTEQTNQAKLTEFFDQVKLTVK